jgi:hypothetical protein
VIGVSASEPSCPESQPLSNPFASRFVRPGALPYLFPDAMTVDFLTDRLADLQWRASIVGSHGSGKTTLLEQLLPLCQRRGRHLERFALHNGQRQLPRRGDHRWHRQTLVVVDGYEQLSWWSRRCLTWSCRLRQCGLLVTSHKNVGLPVLYQTTTDLPRVQRIVDRLLSSAASRITPADVRLAFQAHPENVRELLFALYDVHQSRT